MATQVIGKAIDIRSGEMTFGHPHHNKERTHPETGRLETPGYSGQMLSSIQIIPG